jgi:hypothetical protein
MSHLSIWTALVSVAFWSVGVMSQFLQPLTLFSSATGTEPPAPWRVMGLPKSHKPLTRFEITQLDGRTVLRVQSNHSYANLIHTLPGEAPAPGTLLRWRWRLDQPLAETDLSRKEGDDSALKLCLLFDMPADKLGFMDRGLLSLARSVSEEKLPAATLCYVWDNNLAVGTVLNNAFTTRIRMLVVDSSATHLRQWVMHQRHVIADFHRAFGNESASGVPPLQAVLVGADADNTGGQSLGYVGDITLSQ